MDEAERQAIYEAAWEKGGLQFRASFHDLLLDKAANDTAAEFIKRKIREIVKDPKTAQALADIDHPYAAKRPPIDTELFRDLQPRQRHAGGPARRADRAHHARRHPARARSEYALDIIVFATGFDAMTGPLLRIDIRGRDGRGACATPGPPGRAPISGCRFAGFPNLFTMTGPGSPSVLCNMPVAIEQHVEWITDCIAHMRENGIDC